MLPNSEREPIIIDKFYTVYCYLMYTFQFSGSPTKALTDRSLLPETVHLDAFGQTGQLHEHHCRRTGNPPALSQTQDDELGLVQRDVRIGRRVPVRIRGRLLH